jgi:hypothetical protein
MGENSFDTADLSKYTSPQTWIPFFKPPQFLEVLMLLLFELVQFLH